MKYSKLVIAGGTGFLGQSLSEKLKNHFNEIVVLTRTKKEQSENVRHVFWDGKTLGSWYNQLDSTDILINLAGRSVDCRYNEKNKRYILKSRIDSTNVLGKAINKVKNPPKVWLNSSTATIYRHSLDKKMDEETGEIGSDFSMNVAKAWEKAFFYSNTPQTRKIALRTGIVLGKNGGAFIPLKTMARIGFGGKQGDGQQLVSWIHETDFAKAVEFIIRNESIHGVINVVSPEPIANKIFMASIRKKMQMPIGISLSTPILKIGATLIGTETELVLKSRNVVPKKLLENGFSFQYPTLDSALIDLLG